MSRSPCQGLLRLDLIAAYSGWAERRPCRGTLMSARYDALLARSMSFPRIGGLIPQRPARSDAMKLTASMMVSLDGVYQGPGGRDEDRRGGFERGGWTAPYADEEGWQFLTSWFERADAFLLGRKTWEICERYWPNHDGGDRVSHGINVLPKHVPSTTLRNPTWQNTDVIDGDLESAVRELKATPGRELQLHGSGELLRWLLERDLVDELNLRLYPVVVGDGLRLFPEKGQTHNLALVESRTTATGISLQTYRPAGRAAFGNAGE